MRGQKVKEKKGEIEKRGSGGVTGLRHSANAASHCILSSALPPFLFSPLTPCILIQATLFTLLHPQPPSSLHWLSCTTIIQITFCPISPSQVLFPVFSHFSRLVTQYHLLSHHLTLLENEHQEQAPKGWRARELPQGLVLSFDLTMLRGCPVAGREDCV